MLLTHTAQRPGKLLSFLRGELSLSYGLVKHLKPLHAICVNGLHAHTNQIIRPGDVITVTIEEAPPGIPPQDGPLSILYEDDALLLLDKPAGLIMHPTFHRIDGTLANYIAGYYLRTGQPSAVHFVSRLDRDTSGVALVAKNAHIHALLCGHMQSGRIAKTYHAAVYGHPPAPQGEINLPIARLSPTSLLRCVRGDGKPARSAYRLLETAGPCALLALSPITGRTHQLRVHCAHEGFPLLGDAQYGTPASQAFSLAHGLAHQQLCATSLTFPHPLTGQEMTVRSAQSIHMPGPQRHTPPPAPPAAPANPPQSQSPPL